MTTAGPTPSWYDVLGVAPDSSADEVRAAWRAAIAGLDPTDRRFAVLNEAVRVLLDPPSRTAYDATLAPPADGPGEPAEPAAGAVDEPAAGPAAVEDPTETRPETDGSTAGARGVALVPGWLLAVVAALALATALAAGLFWSREPSAASVEDDTRAAQAAAERAVVPVLSYDGRHLDESKAAAQQYLTGDFRDDYARLFTGLIEQNAPRTGTVVEASLVKSGVVRADDDRVQVFLLVDQSRTNNLSKQPTVFRNWVTLTMEDVGGDWLVADLKN
jgi:Mce-associated membrane protein